MLFRYSSLLRFIPRALLVGILVIGVWKVSARSLFEAMGSFHSDAAIYLTVARGLLHGLIPYKDLFENKAPGVFLLAALSIKLFDGPALLSWLQASVIFLFPFTLVVPVIYIKGWKREAIPFLLVSAIYGCVLALYMADKSGQLLPESFGAFFAAIFVGLCVFIRTRVPTWSILVLSLLFLVTVGMKEPFLLSMVGSAVLVLGAKLAFKTLWRPFIFAVAAGFLLLLFLNQLWPYMTVHLSHMLGFHIFHPWGTVGEPWWLRTIDVIRIWKNLWSFSIFLPFVIVLVWAAAFMSCIQRTVGAKHNIHIFLRWLFATWLHTCAVGLTGDFYSHHFVFALPLFVACFFVYVQQNNAWTFVHTLFVGVVMSLCSLVLLFAQSDFSGLYKEWQRWAFPRQHAASMLDTVMDECVVQRYFLLIDRPEGLYGFTKHLPYGPIFTQYGRFIGALPKYMDAFVIALQTSPIMVMKTREEAVAMNDDTWKYLAQEFTETPWPCAENMQQPLPYRILFRKTMAR
jgi:hypothetical protein